MPNIRESLYQCLANEVTATSTTPTIELCKTESDAYAITIYVVYNGTSFLELNLNSGTIKSGNNFVGYYRIRQAALQENENNSLYLQNKSYYLKFNNIDTTKKIYIRKEIKFGTYTKLLSSESNATLDGANKLTTIAYDEYRNDIAYSNGYFVETQDHTYVQRLAAKNTLGSTLGDNDKPFEHGYIENVTATSILATSIGNEADDEHNVAANPVSNISATTVNADTINIRSTGTINLNNIRFGASQHEYTQEELEAIPARSASAFNIASTGIALESGFDINGRPEFKYVDDTHMYTKYVKIHDEKNDDTYYAQQLVVPGGIAMSAAAGTFSKAFIGKELALSYLITDDSPDKGSLIIDENGVVSKHRSQASSNTEHIVAGNVTGHSNDDSLIFVSNITQNPINGDIEYVLDRIKRSDIYYYGQANNADKQLPITSLGVADALATLDVDDLIVNGNSKAKAGKTLSSLSEIDGKITASLQDIILYDNDEDSNGITGGVTSKSYNEIYVYLKDNKDSNKKWTRLTTALDLFARANHGHGAITNEGKLTATTDSLNGAQLLVRDASDDIKSSGLQFAANFDNEYLSRSGSWQSIPTRTSLHAEADDHKHGNLDHDGKITTEVNNITTNDAIAIVAANDSLLSRSQLKFNTSKNTFFLSQAGQWAEITLATLGGAESGHDHDDNYVMYSASQTLSTSEQSTARANIGAGIVETVTVNGAGGRISTSAAPDSSDVNPKINVDLTEVNSFGTDDLGTEITSVRAEGSSGIKNYQSNEGGGTGGRDITIPTITYDRYGRVVNNGSTTVSIPGHTVDYTIDDTGVLTLTFH